MSDRNPTWASPQPFEMLDHTSDLAIRVCGRTVEETLARLVLAHAQLLTGGSVPTSVAELSLDLPGQDDLALLAVDVLRELNRLFATRGLVVNQVEVLELSGHAVRLRLRHGEYDPQRHREGAEIKAVTYHAASFVRTNGGFAATVVLDV